MGDIIGKIIYFLVVLPVLILGKGFSMFKNFMNKKNWWWALPYFLIVLLSILLVILWTMGYR